MPNQLMSPIFMTVIFIAIFYFLIIRPQKKREKKVKDMRDNLKVGNRVVTIGGIHGSVSKIKDDLVTIEVGTEKVNLKITRWAVGSVVEK